MSINDFATLFARTAFGARPARGKLAAAFAACIVCIAASDGQAATNKFAEAATMTFLTPVAPAMMDDASSASFEDRFDCRENSLIRDFLMSPNSRVLLPREVKPATHEPKAVEQEPERVEPELKGAEREPKPAKREPKSAEREPKSAEPDPLTTASLPPLQTHQNRQMIVPAGETIIGIASMYDPTDAADKDAGTEELSSGERYDANGWTAAIRTDLRWKFGGVRYGRNYLPTFALVQNADKQLIVKINDVGPLRPGRIIDLNKRAMSYFDPTLQLGLIGDVKVTPLAGETWALGPVEDDAPVAVASRIAR
jgi:peptidoglycan lytic transglycosylase